MVAAAPLLEVQTTPWHMEYSIHGEMARNWSLAWGACCRRAPPAAPAVLNGPSGLLPSRSHPPLWLLCACRGAAAAVGRRVVSVPWDEPRRDAGSAHLPAGRDGPGGQGRAGGAGEGPAAGAGGRGAALLLLLWLLLLLLWGSGWVEEKEGRLCRSVCGPGAGSVCRLP